METLFVKQHSLAGHLIEAKRKKKRNTLKGETHLPRVVCCKRSIFFFFIRLCSRCPRLYLDTHRTTPMTLSNATLKTKQDVHDTFGTAHIETIPLFVFSQVPTHTSREKKGHRRQLQHILVHRRSHFTRFFFNTAFTRTNNEKSHPEVIPSNKELRRKLFSF